MSVPMNSLKERAAIARRKSIFAGLLYIIGCIGLAVMSFFPLMEGGVWAYGALNLTTFWKPFAEYIPNFAAFTGNLSVGIVNVLISLLYILMPIVTVINALRAFAKFDYLTMKGRRKYGYNQNKLALDKLANIFAGSLLVLVMHTFVLRLMMAEGGVVTADWTMMFYITLGAAGFIHFVSGMVGGTVSRFTTRDGAMEYPRKHGMFSPFLRNVFQFAAIGGIVFFMRDVSYAQAIIGYACNFSDTLSMFGSTAGLFTIIEALAWMFAVLFVLLMIRHSFNPTEFNACERKESGRKTMRFATFFAFLFFLVVAVRALVETMIGGGAFDFALVNLDMLYAACVALGMFIIECIMVNFPRLKKCYRETAAPVEEPEALVYDVPEDEEEEAAPVVEEPAPAPVALPAPAPVVETPAEPAPVVLSERAVQARSVKSRWIEASRAARAERENAAASTQPKIYSVRCPYCGQTVEVEDGIAADCPACGKKFALKKTLRNLPATPRPIAKFMETDETK